MIRLITPQHRAILLRYLQEQDAREGLPADVQDVAMTLHAYVWPRITVQDAAGKTVASNDPTVPAYADLPVVDTSEACDMAEALGGVVMQKDDPMLPVFTLYTFTRSQA